MSVQTTRPAPPLLATRRAGAVFLAVIAPLGPLFVTLGLFVMPYGSDDDIATRAAKLMESPIAAQWAVLFILLSAVGSMGSLVVAGAIRLGSPRFGAIAAAIAFVGWIAGAYAGSGTAAIASFIAARRRRYPLWVAILLTAAAAAVFVTGSVPGGLLPFAWTLVTVAYAAAGVVYANGFRRVGTGSRAPAA